MLLAMAPGRVEVRHSYPSWRRQFIDAGELNAENVGGEAPTADGGKESPCSLPVDCVAMANRRSGEDLIDR